MSLNIKNERVHDLVRELARLTGQNQTSAVEMAVVRMLAEEQRKRDDRLTRILEAAAAVRASLGPDALEDTDPSAFLYDENGLSA